ncbi:MAG: hypothetical protein KKG09_02455, partial [Verrucomicrobia bacterium]|nr:hypothetical protein [Verrucomicrobiota bacterium]MBU4247364.1 hypothetical protein [Verrucomicrobiota bacterium]MBU4289983.1 hypothetical protein [Verrucomicrobiota bacterium]MBU4496854.1 hypothetical protein [Verrucomicrobiota bacterium]MCG2681522.1 hypothetical protein [Kiritimatiellia bacterium]
GSVYDSEFYKIQTKSLFYAKECSGGSVFQNNHIHDVKVGSLLGFYGSTWTNPVIFRDNVIENSAIDRICYWRANQYQSGVSLISQFYNNTIRNCGTSSLAFHSGGRNCRIWNNKVYSSTLNFTADYNRGQAGGSRYRPGDSAGSIMYDMELDKIHIRDLDQPADQSKRGKMFPFVNVKHNSVTVDMPDDEFHDYKYLDVKVVDRGNNPVKGVTVTVSNNTDGAYPPINLYRKAKISFTTGADGHTPLPSELEDTAAILDFWKTGAAEKQMAYTITASSGGKTASVADVNPDGSWYRSDPKVPVKTILIQLDITVP